MVSGFLLGEVYPTASKAKNASSSVSKGTNTSNGSHGDDDSEMDEVGSGKELSLNVQNPRPVECSLEGFMGIGFSVTLQVGGKTYKGFTKVTNASTAQFISPFG